MYGLINKSVQAFLRDNYGSALWAQVAHRAGIGVEGFEAMLRYDDSLTEHLIDAACAVLDRPRNALLEDIGAHLVTFDTVRRLLRFGGVDYCEFLFSLNELQDRGRMALGDLELPSLFLIRQCGGRFLFEVRGAICGWGAVTAGLLRAMADDYGALALIEDQEPAGHGAERVQVLLLDPEFNTDRGFALTAPRSRGAA
ncbi:heme NO-binding domain-containing protein [Paenirhodobacter populi]|uniref:Heme NO-binding protein n=1 Tax=Paenirhodobacter populi TaxID=2306993 RepID=A0A443IXR8_9RHOB|nr:heme NO-binding domain-containing protein [Sinirhodobacter populi]RWR09413.1 heme NO-binding protein [Sinirhodobacter populi]RWR12981.1 heme NO-binding protein [Sinirhodobacter populi]RWR34107.1 heme NO-binding protein [Sinirhodobacter populi]